MPTLTATQRNSISAKQMPGNTKRSSTDQESDQTASRREKSISAEASSVATTDAQTSTPDDGAPLAGQNDFDQILLASGSSDHGKADARVSARPAVKRTNNIGSHHRVTADAASGDLSNVYKVNEIDALLGSDSAAQNHAVNGEFQVGKKSQSSIPSGVNAVRTQRSGLDSGTQHDSSKETSHDTKLRTARPKKLKKLKTLKRVKRVEPSGKLKRLKSISRPASPASAPPMSAPPEVVADEAQPIPARQVEQQQPISRPAPPVTTPSEVVAEDMQDVQPVRVERSQPISQPSSPVSAPPEVVVDEVQPIPARQVEQQPISRPAPPVTTPSEVVADEVRPVPARPVQHSQPVEHQQPVAPPTPPANIPAEVVANQVQQIQPAMAASSASVIPVPMPVPMMMPQPVASPSDPEVEKRTPPETKLPDPQETKQVDSSSGESPDGDSEESEQKSESADPKGKITSSELAEISDEHAAFLKAFQQSIDNAKKGLFKDQAAQPAKVPGKIAKLESSIAVQLKEDRDKAAITIRRLGSTRHICAIPVLKDYLQNRHTQIQLAAVEGVKQIPDAAASAVLLDVLRASDPAVAEAAIRALAFLHREETVAPLVFASMAKPNHLSVLVEQIVGDDEDVQQEYAEHLQKLLRSKTPRFVAGVIRLLNRLSGKEKPDLYLRCASHSSPQVRAAAVEAMAICKGNKVVRALNKSLTDDDSSVRQAAAVSLARVNSPKSVVLLLRALKDDEVLVRRKAAKALAEIEDQRIPVAAATALEQQTDPTVIEHLLQALGQTVNKRGLLIIKRYLDGDNVELRHRAIMTLKRLRDKRSAKLLRPFLDSENEVTRRLTVEAYGLLKEPRILPELRRTLQEDSDAAVRTAAARALGELEDSESIPLLELSLESERATRIQAMIALGKMKSQRSLPALLAQLQDSAPEVRYHAATAIGELPELPSHEPLLALADDSDDMVRRGVRAAMEKHGVKYRSNKIQKKLKSLAASVTPSHLAGGLPFGPIVAVTLIVACLGGGIYALVNSELVGGIGSSFDVLRIEQAAISPDGKYVTVSRRMNVFETWDTAAKTLVHRMQLSSGVFGIEFSDPETAFVFVSGKPKQVTLNADTTEESFKDAPLKDVGTDQFVLSKDTKLGAFVGANRQVSIVELPGGTLKQKFQISGYSGQDQVVLTNGAKWLLHGAKDGQLTVYDGTSGNALGKLSLRDVLQLDGKIELKAMAVDASSEVLAVAMGGQLALIDLNTMQIVGTQKPNRTVIRLRFLDDTKDIVYADDGGGFGTVTNSFSKQTKLNSSSEEPPESVRFSADGQVALMQLESAGFVVIDIKNDQVLIDDKLSSE